MADPSFDVVSKVDRQEVDNALQQAAKEVGTRFDFRGVGASIAWSGEQGVEIRANSEERAKAVPPGTLLRNSEILMAGARCHRPARGLAPDGQLVRSASQVQRPDDPVPGQAELLLHGADRVLRLRAEVPVDEARRAERRSQRLDPGHHPGIRCITAPMSSVGSDSIICSCQLAGGCDAIGGEGAPDV